MMMGYEFKTLSGIDPLTIDQTHMMERSDTTFEAPEYRYATLHGLVTRPTFFQDKLRRFFDAGANDMHLFHPRAVYKHGRPAWLALDGRRKTYVFDPSAIDIEPPYAVRAFIKGERPARRYFIGEFPLIPLDQIEITSGSESKALLLYEGTYEVHIVTRDGKMKDKMEISIDVIGN